NGKEGVLILQGATGNTVGGPAPGAGNLLSGNTREGVGVTDAGTAGNVVQGNLIGSDVSGTSPSPNGDQGVLIQAGAAGNTGGGAAPGAGNVTSGNAREGALIKAAGTSGTLVQGNRIGADVTGTAALGNARDGVHIVTASGNTVGGTAAGAGNVVAFNGN